MVRSGEESGKLNQTFNYLADHLDRSYALTTKARNALIYPSFVITVFIGVMILMFTMVIPRLSAILIESGQEIPFFTRIVMGLSNFLINYGIFALIILVIGGFFLRRYTTTPSGRISLARFKISIPYIGGLYKKLYLARIAGNMHTLLLSGVSIIRTIENIAASVGNDVYKQILEEASESVQAGKSLSDSLSSHEEIPSIMIQMIKIGEETGELGNILETLAKFYEREVNNAVDTLVSLIEPALIVALGLGVGVLLSSILIPIYNVSSGI
jgi:type IV pilus assembly protein PilC